MKRERRRCDGFKASLHKIWYIFSWELCVVCQLEFRREHGWLHSTHKSNSIHRYICCECCPTDKEALAAMEKYVSEWNEKLKLKAHVF